MRQLISSTGQNDHRPRDGFTLLEVVCVVAILAILAGLIVPALPRGTSRARLESYAIATAALLKSDRNAAIRRRIQVVTYVDAGSRLVRSGATSRVIRVPDDVAVDALLTSHCNHELAGRSIRFFSSGLSCGGVIAFSRLGVSYEVRVHWLTGGIDVVPSNRT